MDQPYYDFLLSNTRNGSTQHTMGPPSSPRSAATQHQRGYALQSHSPNYIYRDIPPAPDHYADSAGHMWHHSGDAFSVHPQPPRVDFPDAATRPDPPVRSSIHTQNPLGRTTTISAAEWTRHKTTIHKLWIKEDKALLEMRLIMSDKYDFHASVDQYKKQFRKWNWSKNIPTHVGEFIRHKAGQREMEEGKDTEFNFRGRTLTRANIQSYIERNKGDSDPQGPLDIRTPTDIKYRTPTNPINSPSDHRNTATRIAQPSWIPPAKFDRSQPQMRLIWNGFTKADFEAQYTEALAEERSGRPHDAEAKLRSALEGFDRLLSTTHPQTVAIAYKLASFFADQVRMQDADTVLDWLNQAYLDDFGLVHARTLDHILNVCDMFRNWGRPEQAADLLQQVLREGDKEVSGPKTACPPTTDQSQHNIGTSTQTMTNSHAQEHAMLFSIPSDGPAAPSALRAQISQLSRGSETNQGDEAVLLRLMRHCEQYPDELLVYSLLCYPILLDYYEHRDDVVNKSDALDRAQLALWSVLQSQEKKTRDILVACLQLTKCLIKAARYESADDIFSQIECDAQETFGTDDTRTIWFLENIGTFYQNEGRWQDAAPRFEHALAARLSRYGERHESVRRLEDALENRYFETYVPSQDKDTFEHVGAHRPVYRFSAPEIIVLGPRTRGRLSD